MSLRRAAERVLAGSGLAARLARRRPPRRIVLAYHNVLPDDVTPDGDRSLHLPRARFAEHLDLLMREARVLPLADLLDRSAPSADDRRPSVAITFDDAYAGAVVTAVAELVARRLPATICVAPAFLGGRLFWWDALAAPGGELDPAVREAVLTGCAGDDRVAREWAAAQGRAIRDDFPWPYRCCTGAQLDRALANPGITVASHTWHHRNMARLGEAEIRTELERSLAWLGGFAERAVAIVTWPYGIEVRAAHAPAASAGYRAGFRVTGGALPDSGEQFALPRVNVPAGMTADGLLLRLAGILGG